MWVRNSNFDLSWVIKYPTKPWNIKEILENVNIVRKYIKKQDFNKLKNLDKEEIIKYFSVICHNPESKIFNIYPGLFYQIDQPIELQDLSGDIYYLENWFTQENILAYAKEQLPDLGEFDIAVDAQDGTEELLMASKTDVGTLKNHLFQGKDGPQGMIVYL